jgi:glutamine synthetase
MNCAGPMAVLLGAVADSIGSLSERLKKKLGGGGERDQAVLELLREVFRETAPVRFGGNNYSDEWKAEAARRGLPNLADTPAALEMLRDPRRTAFLRERAVFTELELSSRYNIAIERYIKHVTLEAETLLELLRTFVIPAGEKQLAGTLGVWGGLNAAAGAKLADTARGATEAGAGAFTRRVAELSAELAGVMGMAGELQALLEDLDAVHDEAKAARRLADEVRPLMDKVRASADRLEHLVDDGIWSLPKYREMLFVR